MKRDIILILEVIPMLLILSKIEDIVKIYLSSNKDSFY